MFQSSLMNIKKHFRTKLIISWSILPTLEKLSLLIQSEKKRINNDKTTDPILQQWSIGGFYVGHLLQKSMI